MNGALLLIDLQNDYFPGGANPLEGAEEAVARAARLLAEARGRGLRVVHVQHLSTRPGAGFFLPGTPGAEIHAAVAPLPGETVLVKHKPNSFQDTELEALLAPCLGQPVWVAGMMTHMCVDSTVRAGWERGHQLVLAGDACATRALPLPGGGPLPAAQVHEAFLTALGGLFARVARVDEILDGPAR